MLFSFDHKGKMMKNSERKGQIAIRPGNENQEPSAVYVAGINKFDLLICKRLNTSEILLSDPEQEDLMDLDVELLDRMLAQWRVENAERRLSLAKANLAEVMEKTG